MSPKAARKQGFGNGENLDNLDTKKLLDEISTLIMRKNQRIISLEGLLKAAHAYMDEFNTQLDYCYWCQEKSGYDGDGLIHTEDCILRQIRRVVDVQKE